MAPLPPSQPGVRVGGWAGCLCLAWVLWASSTGSGLHVGLGALLPVEQGSEGSVVFFPPPHTGVPGDVVASSPHTGSWEQGPPARPWLHCVQSKPSSRRNLRAWLLRGRGLWPNPPPTLMSSPLVLQTVLCSPCLLHVLLP